MLQCEAVILCVKSRSKIEVEVPSCVSAQRQGNFALVSVKSSSVAYAEPWELSASSRLALPTVEAIGQNKSQMIAKCCSCSASKKTQSFLISLVLTRFLALFTKQCNGGISRSFYVYLNFAVYWLLLKGDISTSYVTTFKVCKSLVPHT